MEKLIIPSEHESLLRNAGELSTLIESERNVKSASSSAMTRQMLEDCRPDSDHFLQHVIAVGDHEHYGHNKNGDAFPKAACDKYHPTFVSHGHFFREHRNRDPKKAIGIVKASCYNPEMGRIELAVWGHKKAAAEEYDIAKSGKPLSYSMSCKVAYDRDSITDKKSRTPAEYEPHCKRRMGQWIPEHNKFAFVYNDHPDFFDISRVANPADRIAHVLEYFMPLEKAAAESTPPNGVELALTAGVSLPGTEGHTNSYRLQLMQKLAAAETYLDAFSDGTAPADARSHFVKNAGVYLVDQVDNATLAGFRGENPASLMRKLASAGVVLPFYSWAAYAHGKPLVDVMSDPMLKEAHDSLPGVFRRMLTQPAVPELENLFEPSSLWMAGRVGCSIKGASVAAVRGPELLDRVLHNASIGRIGTLNTTKSAGNAQADAYGHYVICALADEINDETLLVAAIQNRL